MDGNTFVERRERVLCCCARVELFKEEITEEVGNVLLSERVRQDIDFKITV